MLNSLIMFFTFLILSNEQLLAASNVEIVSASQREIRQVVNANMGQVKKCYVEEYYNGRKSKVIVSLAITTNGWGKVSAVKLIEVAHSLKKKSPKPFLHCLISKIYNWQFPITGAKSRRFVQDFQIGS